MLNKKVCTVVTISSYLKQLDELRDALARRLNYDKNTAAIVYFRKIGKDQFNINDFEIGG